MSTKRTNKKRAMPFTLELLAQAITERWATDPTTPGLVASFLPYKDPAERYYVSIARYEQYFGKGKRVVFCAYAESFDAAARKVAGELVKPTAMESLAASI